MIIFSLAAIIILMILRLRLLSKLLLLIRLLRLLSKLFDIILRVIRLSLWTDTIDRIKDVFKLNFIKFLNKVLSKMIGIL